MPNQMINRITLLLALLLPLVACQSVPQQSAKQSAQQSTEQQPAGQEVAAQQDITHTPAYRVAIYYPALQATDTGLMQWLKSQGQAAKADFIAAAQQTADLPTNQDRQQVLEIHYRVVSRVGHWVSLVESGYRDTGGAHPSPIDAGLVYDTQHHRLVTLSDLFGDHLDKVLTLLSNRVRPPLAKHLLQQGQGFDSDAAAQTQLDANMQQMLTAGTRPEVDNFASFTLLTKDQHATGLRLRFSVYQVAPYVYGEQQQDISANLFRAYLTAPYRKVFQ